MERYTGDFFFVTREAGRQDKVAQDKVARARDQARRRGGVARAGSRIPSPHERATLEGPLS